MNPVIAVLALIVFDNVYFAIYPLIVDPGNPIFYWCVVSVIVMFAIVGASLAAKRQAKINESVLLRLDEINRGLIRIRDEHRDESERDA